MQHTRSKDRVRTLGEVFTAPHVVKAMVGMVDDTASDRHTSVLEPAVGTGNFLVEILQRRIEKVLADFEIRITADPDRFHFQCLTALSNLYGVEIDVQNVVDCRERLLRTFSEAIQMRQYKAVARQGPAKVRKAAESILSVNIMHDNFLTPSETGLILDFIAMPNLCFLFDVRRLADVLLNRRSKVFYSQAPCYYTDLPDRIVYAHEKVAHEIAPHSASFHKPQQEGLF